MQVAAGCVPRVADRVVFVALAPLRDAALVLPAIAQTLGIADGAGHPLTERLHASLRDTRLLLVLDNCEQVVAAAPDVAALLQASPRLTVLATSRTPLHLAGEHQYAVPPLAVPTRDQVHTPDAVLAYAAVQLFVARAGAVQHDFALIGENAGAVGRVVPAAGRAAAGDRVGRGAGQALPPPTLLTRLRHRLDLLTDGARDLPARQQTLRTAIAWSYDLLDARTQRLFAQLAVFAGGFTVAAVEAVCRTDGDRPGTVLDGLQALLDASLIEALDGDGDAPRFHLLETIGEYAHERLETGGAAEPLGRLHAQYYLDLAEATTLERADGAQQVTWLQQLELEHDNLRTALHWALDCHELTFGLRLGSALGRFWLLHGHVTEGRHWLEAVLARCSTLDPGAEPGANAAPLRATALHAAGWLATQQRDYDRAVVLLEQSLALARTNGDQPQVLAALLALGQLRRQQGDYGRAVPLLEASVALSRELGDPRSEVTALGNLGSMARQEGDLTRAAALLEACLALSRAIGYQEGIGWACSYLARVTTNQGDYGRSAALLRESLDWFRAVDRRDGIAHTLEGFGCIAAAEGQTERAARLLGAAHTGRVAVQVPLNPAEEQLDVIPAMTAARARLAAAAWEAAWAAGQTMTLEQAVAYALDEQGERGVPPAADVGDTEGSARRTTLLGE